MPADDRLLAPSVRGQVPQDYIPSSYIPPPPQSFIQKLVGGFLRDSVVPLVNLMQNINNYKMKHLMLDGKKL